MWRAMERKDQWWRLNLSNPEDGIFQVHGIHQPSLNIFAKTICGFVCFLQPFWKITFSKSTVGNVLSLDKAQRLNSSLFFFGGQTKNSDFFGVQFGSPSWSSSVDLPGASTSSSHTQQTPPLENEVEKLHVSKLSGDVLSCWCLLIWYKTLFNLRVKVYSSFDICWIWSHVSMHCFDLDTSYDNLLHSIVFKDTCLR